MVSWSAAFLAASEFLMKERQTSDSQDDGEQSSVSRNLFGFGPNTDEMGRIEGPNNGDR
jgi:hypothetical protein